MPPAPASEASSPPPSNLRGDTLSASDELRIPKFGPPRLGRSSGRREPVVIEGGRPADALDEDVPIISIPKFGPPRLGRSSGRREPVVIEGGRPADDAPRSKKPRGHLVAVPDVSEPPAPSVADDTTGPEKLSEPTTASRPKPKRRLRGPFTPPVVPALAETKATAVVGDGNETEAPPVVPEPPATQAVVSVPAPREIPSDISREEAQKLEAENPAKPYGLLHHAPDAGEHPYETRQKGWLRPTIDRARKKAAEQGRQVLDAAIGVIGAAGLNGVVERAEMRPPGGYQETEEMSAVEGEGESTAEVSRVDEGPATAESALAKPSVIDDRGPVTAESELAKPAPEPAWEPPTGEPEVNQTVPLSKTDEGEATGEYSPPDTGERQNTVEWVAASRPITEGNEINSVPAERRGAWGDFNSLVGSDESTPADIIDSARHVLDAYGNTTNVARKLAQDVMYYANGPEAKQFVEELAQGRLEGGNENTDDVRRELLQIAALDTPLPRQAANVELPKGEIKVAQDGSVIYPKILPQLPDQEKEAIPPTDAGMQMHALRALDEGDFGGWRYLPEPVKAQLQGRQLMPGQANNWDKRAIAEVSQWGTRFVASGGGAKQPETQQIPTTLAS